MSFEGELLEDHPLIRVRYDKAADYRANGGNPFVNRFMPTHQAAELQADGDRHAAEETPVRVAGRMLTVKSFGSLSFFHLQDATGRIQVAVHKKGVPEGDMELFKKTLDTGDIVGVEGTMTRTKTGELTVHAHRIYLLSKSMRALPEKYHGLKDQELRYRQRYVDLIVNPEVKKVFELRSRIIAAFRRNLDLRGYMEVETPMMQPMYGGGAAKPFITHHNALDMDLYLRIAPELYLKRLLVGGFDKVYEVNRNFRNEGLSIRHNPEFTMVELYTAWWDYTDTMNLSEELITDVAQEVCGTLEMEFLGKPLSLARPWARRTILDLIRDTLGVNSERTLRWGTTDAESREFILSIIPDEHKGAILGSDGGAKKSNDKILFELFEAAAEPTLWQPTFVMEFPRSLCPLAKSKPDDQATAERFEIFIGGMEMGNAYSELNDPYDQLERFRDQERQRNAGDEEATGVDADYVRALEYGMPPASGLGIGIDRIVMMLTNSSSIRDVILFPQMRPEVDHESTRMDTNEQPGE